MQQTPPQSDDFVASFARQRQQLLYHAGAALTPQDNQASAADATKLAQLLVSALEALKVAEDELREDRRTRVTTRAALERQAAHAHALFRLAPVPLFLTTADSSIREANAAAEKLIGSPAAKLEGKQLLSKVPADQQATFKEQLALVLQMGEVAAWSFRLNLERNAPQVVTAAVHLVEDPGIGTRALYWYIRPVEE